MNTEVNNCVTDGIRSTLSMLAFTQITSCRSTSRCATALGHLQTCHKKLIEPVLCEPEVTYAVN